MKNRLLTVALLVAAGACADTNTTGSLNGRTQILLTDDPFPYGQVAHVNVYVKEIAASTTLDTSNGTSSSWTIVAQPEKVFDLLSLQGGATALAGELSLTAGQYRAVRLVINTSLSSVVDTAGHAIGVHWPVAGELALYAYVEHALDVTSDGARIVIDFDVGRTFLADGAGGFLFSPWIRAVNDAATGNIVGTVAGPDIEGGLVPLPNVTVFAYTAGPGIAGAIVGTARTDGQGRYVIGFLGAGSYGVAAQAPSVFSLHSGAVFVTVPAGGQVRADLQMSRDSVIPPDTTHTTPGGPVATVTLRIGTPSASTSIAVNDSIPLTAELRDAQGATLLGRTVTWTVSDSTVLPFQGVFGQYAIVRGRTAGTATVTVASEGKSASRTFTVSGSGGGGGGGNAPVATVTLSPPSLTLNVGDSAGVNALLKDSTGTTLFGRTVTWSVADTTVVRVIGGFGSYLVVRARASGTTSITATSEGKQATAGVTIR
jgi:hypothetical protein